MKSARTMQTVGIRELKTHLSHHLRRVRSGARLVVTERGRMIASIQPVDAPANLNWAHALVANGDAQWAGGKPGAAEPSAAVHGPDTVASAVIEDRA